MQGELADLRSRAPLPENVPSTANLLIAGVGGTGVVTVSALLGTAAHLDGLAVSTLDMTGLAQKGGAVFGHVRIGQDADALHGTRIAAGQTDLLLACDLITGASRDALTLADGKKDTVGGEHRRRAYRGICSASERGSSGSGASGPD